MRNKSIATKLCNDFIVHLTWHRLHFMLSELKESRTLYPPAYYREFTRTINPISWSKCTA